MRRVCVFCGSAEGARPEYALAARQLAEVLASRQLGLVYGGGHVGLMGILADAALAAGCEVIGVIPEALHQREFGHEGLTTLHVVGFWEPLIAMVDRMVDQGFIQTEYRRMLCVEDEPTRLLDRMSQWRPPAVPKWLRAGET
ncbi:MAG TPA: hypothetical protein VM869_25065 [Enhygromyxa sp.]|nr:hypothetical protein [Enhygromyxa sp.]